MKPDIMKTGFSCARGGRFLAAAFCLACAVSAPAAVVVTSDEVQETDGSFSYDYSNFTYANLGSSKTGLFATATVTGFNSTVQQQGSGAGSTRWFKGGDLSASVVYTFDFSESGFTPESLTIVADQFRTFSGYGASATATFTGDISVDGGATWTTIYSADVNGGTSTFASSILPTSPISLTSFSGGATIQAVKYRFSYTVTGGASTGAFIGYDYVRYDDGLPGLNVSFAVTPTAVPEAATAALFMGGVAFLGAGLMRWRARR